MTKETFRACRLYLDKTQTEFAKYIGISKAQVGRIESGSLEVTPRVKAKLLSKFDINDSFLSFCEKINRIN